MWINSISRTNLGRMSVGLMKMWRVICKLLVFSCVLILSTSATEQLTKVRDIGGDEPLVDYLSCVFHFATNFELSIYSYKFYIYIAASAVLVSYLYQVLFVPINRVRLLEEIGYSSDGNLTKKEIAENYKRSREVGGVPPVYPNGWFGLIESFNVKRGEALSISALGLNLAVFRDEKGESHVLDAYCPHLGANIAEGGRVIGDCLECPNDGWRFRGSDGKITKIHNTDKIPEMAKVKSWPKLEINGWIFLWYHAEGADPTWLPPEREELTSGYWKFSGRAEVTVNSQISDMPENGADIAHFDFIHTPSSLYGILAPLEKLLNTTLLKFTYDVSWTQSPAPDQHIGTTTINESRFFFGIEVKNSSQLVWIGPGLAHVEIGTTGMFMILTLLPVEPLLVKVVVNIYQHWALPSFIAGKFLLVPFIKEITKDNFIYNTRKYCEKPMFVKSKADSVLANFRRHYSQFYSANSPRLHTKKYPLN